MGGGAVAATVIAVVLISQSVGSARARLASILWGVLAGYLVCGIFGWLHHPVSESAFWITLPRFLPHGFAFQWKFVLPFAVHLPCLSSGGARGHDGDLPALRP